MKYIDTGALFSDCGQYRYALWREWEKGSGIAMFLMLNPSTADEKQDDPTIRRCIGFAQDWGHKGVVICNIFAFRATDPAVMKDAIDPVGPKNDQYITACASGPNVQRLVAAWGNHGTHDARDVEVMKLLRSHGHQPFCFGTTKAKQPKHPLYLDKRTRLIGYRGA